MHADAAPCNSLPLPQQMSINEFYFSSLSSDYSSTHPPSHMKMRIFLLVVVAIVLQAAASSESTAEPDPARDDDSEQENDTSRKVIGSRYVQMYISTCR